jgi:hypothetical protein
MKLYTYSTARQRLAEVLEEASREGEVQIRNDPPPTLPLGTALPLRVVA